jgi:hypothetical protein
MIGHTEIVIVIVDADDAGPCHLLSLNNLLDIGFAAGVYTRTCACVERPALFGLGLLDSGQLRQLMPVDR